MSSEEQINWGASPVPFIPGLELNEAFYREAVRPLLERHFPGLRHTAGLVGYGSDVLGFDTPMSRDHMWGPRLVLFLPDDDLPRLRDRVDVVLRAGLPVSFHGYPTHFGPPDVEGTRIMQALEVGPVDHLVQLTTPADFVRSLLAFDRSQEPEPLDWLAFPEQKLLELTAGRLFHDDLDLESTRRRLSYYPRDVWLYLLASQWARIGQEEHFVGRSGQAGDELGSRVIAARLVHDLMRLGFLMERRYAPYSKWFGSAFRRLEIAGELGLLLEKAFGAQDWKERDAALAEAYTLCARRHNALGITPPLEAEARRFYGRPFRVLFAGRFAEAIRERIKDPQLRELPLYGSVSQLTTTTDLLEDPPACRRLRAVYETPPSGA